VSTIEASYSKIYNYFSILKCDGLCAILIDLLEDELGYDAWMIITTLSRGFGLMRSDCFDSE
jgi:hypothetical protein